MPCGYRTTLFPTCAGKSGSAFSEVCDEHTCSSLRTCGGVSAYMRETGGHAHLVRLLQCRESLGRSFDIIMVLVRMVYESKFPERFLEHSMIDAVLHDAPYTHTLISSAVAFSSTSRSA